MPNLDKDPIELLCVDRLRESLNPATALFDRQLRRGKWGSTRGTEGITSTAIALIGLARSGIEPARVGMDLIRTREALLAMARVRRTAGSVGLAIWASSVTGGRSVSDVLGRLGLSLGDIPRMLRRSQTMEIAWILSGLAHEGARAPARSTREAFLAARAALLDRFVGPSQTFRHATDDAPPLRRARQWVANFADQIYPIQALAQAAMLEPDSQALEVATRSAEHMLALQGELGQWWWHYDARDGRVAQHYPVYSVHQHGMAPMALQALAAAGGPNFAAAIDRSQRWLIDNERGASLIDTTAGTIWRSIERDEGHGPRYARRVRSVLGLKGADKALTGRLTINRETRPYEWAWCLYAGALAREGRNGSILARDGLPGEGSSVRP
jgi:hypothetical protein